MRNCNIVKLLPNAARKMAAKDVRAKLFEKCRTNAEQAGDDIAGFAIVLWDRNGNLWSSYDAQIGVVGPALMPTLVHDSLNRHVAVALAADKMAADASN